MKSGMLFLCLVITPITAMQIISRFAFFSQLQTGAIRGSNLLTSRYSQLQTAAIKGNTFCLGFAGGSYSGFGVYGETGGWEAALQNTKKAPHHCKAFFILLLFPQLQTAGIKRLSSVILTF